jgi:hypothetical protein
MLPFKAFASCATDADSLPTGPGVLVLRWNRCRRCWQPTDAIVGFLHRVHRRDRTPPPSPRAFYNANEAFNDSVDESHGMIRIFEVEFRPSEVLYEMEPESYRVYLADFDGEAERPEAGRAEVVP